MSVNRVLRFLSGLIVATILLGIGLTLAGFPSSKYLPPPVVYSHATGTARGVVIGKEVSPTANPFHVGDHIFIINYAFRAPPPLAKGETKPGPTQRYYGAGRIDSEGTYDEVKNDDFVPVKYETTYPDINGIDDPQGGRSIGPGSNILSGWLLFVLLDLVLAYILMVFVFERFGRKEDI